MSYWTHGSGFNLSWRLSVIAQFVPALLLCVGLPFVPERYAWKVSSNWPGTSRLRFFEWHREQWCWQFTDNSPRWLIEKGRFERAKQSLRYIRGSHCVDEVQQEFDDIKENTGYHKVNSTCSWRALFTDSDLFARLWRVALLQFMAQMCGSTAMKYYLPTNFIALGLGKEMSLLASGIESSLKVGCTVIEMMLIDRAGRKTTLVLGSIIMAVALLVLIHITSSGSRLIHVQINGALPLAYPQNINHISDYACVVFIFFFSFGYSIGFGPNAWVYGSEVRSVYRQWTKGLKLIILICRSFQHMSEPKDCASLPVQARLDLLLLLNSGQLLCRPFNHEHISYSWLRI